MNHWVVLNIKPTSDQRAIKKAYAACLKTISLDDTDEFSELRNAYELALEDTRNRKYVSALNTAIAPEPSTTSLAEAQRNADDFLESIQNGSFQQRISKKVKKRLVEERSVDTDMVNRIVRKTVGLHEQGLEAEVFGTFLKEALMAPEFDDLRAKALLEHQLIKFADDKKPKREWILEMVSIFDWMSLDSETRLGRPRVEKIRKWLATPIILPDTRYFRDSSYVWMSEPVDRKVHPGTAVATVLVIIISVFGRMSSCKDHNDSSQMSVRPLNSVSYVNHSEQSWESADRDWRLAYALKAADLSLVEDALREDPSVLTSKYLDHPPIFYAMDLESDVMTREFVRRGALLEAYNSKGFTPLQICVLRRDTQKTRLLLELGADVLYPSESGHNAWQLAATLDNREMLVLLSEHVSDKRGRL